MTVMTIARPLLRCALLPLLFASLWGADADVPGPGAQNKTPPKPIKREAPQYPHNMRRAGLTGKVRVEFVIDSHGDVQNPVVVSSNNPWFERPAIDAILKWKFAPAEINGRKVNTRSRQDLEFGITTTRGLYIMGGGGSDLGGTRDESRNGDEGLWSVPPLKDPEKLPPMLRWKTAPRPVNTAFPVYPFAALQAGVSGSTEIKFIVGPEGRIVGSELVSASTPEMGQAVLAMIDTWKFTPPKDKDGVPCHAALTMKHDFKRGADSDAPVSDEARQILKLLEKSPEKIAKAGELDGPLKPLSRRPPVYPTTLLKSGKSGQAVIEFYVDRQGDAQLPHIVSSTEPEFGYAAVQAIATWRFEAPLKGGKPVPVQVRIPMEFNLPAGGNAG
ncbi:MAG TPA: energy transducer TonB [Lacunisphaera sp.]|nr:energy transducer TonB [Lacunisphaera sp.]